MQLAIHSVDQMFQFYSQYHHQAWHGNWRDSCCACGFRLFLSSAIEHEKSLKMSKQDIKDEYKKSEGDPLIKGKIRERQRRMALQRMMQEVPKADVIITNPTHFAIALQYDGTKMEAPTDHC